MAVNTAGSYLEFDDPRLCASRVQVRDHISHGGVHKWLVLNCDQVWRQALRSSKHVYMRERSRGLVCNIDNTFFLIGCPRNQGRYRTFFLNFPS